MNIEIQAVTAAAQHFGWAESLEPQFETHDKVINADGPIQIYSGPGREKSTHIGAAKVQIKGKRWTKPFQDDASHSVTIVELEGYLKERGLIFITGHVNPKTRQVALYYITLHPFKILDFLGKSRSQNSITLRLARLPEDAEQLVRIARFSHIAQQEDPSNHGKPFVGGNGFTLQIASTDELEFQRPLRLDRAESGIDFTVFRTDQNGLRTPIDGAFELIPMDYVDHETKLSFASSTVAYTNIIGRRLDDDTFRGTLSENLYIDWKAGDVEANISVTINSGGSVWQFAQDLAFYLGCLDEGSMWINGRQKHFNSLDQASDMRDQKESIDRIMETLQFINVDPKLVFVDDLTDKVQTELETLRESLIEGRALDLEFPRSGRVAIPIGEHRIELLLELLEDSHEWIVHNPYAVDFDKHYYTHGAPPGTDESRDETEGASVTDNEVRFVTPFDTLDVDDIIATLNLNLSKAVDIYKKLPASSDRLTLANSFVLKLLLASDGSDSRRDEFLWAAENLTDWMLEGKEDPDPVFQVNSWQVSARMGGLDQRELDQVRKLRKSVDRQDGKTYQHLGYCLSILLGEAEDAAFRKDEMSEEARRELEDWPINALLTSAP